MACKHCIPEVNSKTGEPILDENGEQFFHCPIDCLPIRGRLQRLVYENIYGENEYANVVKCVQISDPSVAQGNISRAISKLKELGYVYEGENLDNNQRVLCTAVAYKRGDTHDESRYVQKVVTVTAKELRHLLFWFLSRRPVDTEIYRLTDKDLIRIVSFITSFYDQEEGLLHESIYELMEPLVKKTRYVVSTLSDKPIQCPKSLGEKLELENWQRKKLTPLRKQKNRGAGWSAYLPYFEAEWNVMKDTQDVSPTVREVIAQKEANDEHWKAEYAKDGLTYTGF